MPYCMNLRSPLHDYALAALAVGCVSLHRTWPSAGKHINSNPICAKLTRLTWELCVCHVHVRYDARRVSDFGPSPQPAASCRSQARASLSHTRLPRRRRRCSLSACTSSSPPPSARHRQRGWLDTSRARHVLWQHSDLFRVIYSRPHLAGDTLLCLVQHGPRPQIQLALRLLRLLLLPRRRHQAGPRNRLRGLYGAASFLPTRRIRPRLRRRSARLLRLRSRRRSRWGLQLDCCLCRARCR